LIFDCTSDGLQVCHNDEIYLVSEKEQRYIRVGDAKDENEPFYRVCASFQRTKWTIVPYRPSDQAGESSGNLSGGDVIQIRLQQNDEFFSVAPEDNFTDASSSLYLQKQAQNIQIMQTLWQLEATKQRWAGSHVEVTDTFRLKRCVARSFHFLSSCAISCTIPYFVQLDEQSVHDSGSTRPQRFGRQVFCQQYCHNIKAERVTSRAELHAEPAQS
jgi:hypothetical protein